MARRVDLNRIQKTYPYIRRKPIYRFIGETSDSASGGTGSISAEIETAEITWDGLSTKTYNFTVSFSSIPKVVAISKNDNINVFIDSVTINSVTVSASAVSNESFIIHAINVLWV